MATQTTSASLFKGEGRPSDQGQSSLVLLLAITIFALSASAVVALISVSDDTSREALTQQRLSRWKEAILLYASHNAAALPASLATLQGTVATCSVSTAGTLSGYCGPYYVSEIYPDAELRKDAWGTALVYDSAARTLKSCGANQTCGNSDDWTVSF